MDTYKLVRVLPGGTEMQIMPSLESDSLIVAGKKLTEDHPDFDLCVVSPQEEILWRNKGTPDQGSAPQKND